MFKKPYDIAQAVESSQEECGLMSNLYAVIVFLNLQSVGL